MTDDDNEIQDLRRQLWDMACEVCTVNANTDRLADSCWRWQAREVEWWRAWVGPAA